jgi:DNA-binding transcriptional regulator YiaG
MSNEDEKAGNNQSDPGLNNQNNSTDQNVPLGDNEDQKNDQKAGQKKGQKKDQKKDQKTGKQEMLTIEEHKKNLNVSAPVFAAVIQAKGWASGKRVPVEVFDKAVKDFLGAPMDGVMEDIPTIEEHQKKLKIDAPVLEAVIKAKGWRLNSKVPEEALTEAVKEYLDALKKEGGK